ncbi:MAG: indole-3-glycerol phosphate synthase TrpC [Armatimonadetes bacterium]|nr:indole-3-glycerol phosphate synthase TrpC [Armatimonadota bacterium]
MILDEIVSWKRREVARRKELFPLAEMERRLARMPPCRPLAEAIRREKEIALIAEIKRASPSKGVIRQAPFDPAEFARVYTEAGAAAISVVTEEKFFAGRLEFLPAVRQATTLPVLRKDFLIDPYQLLESRFCGSDAVLLIAAVLSDRELAAYQRLAAGLGLSCLVEVHTREELTRALDSGAAIIGINNRDLRTFQTNLNTTFSLRRYIPGRGVVVVSESGISSRAHMLALQEHEVDAALVGEALMRSPDVAGKVRELLGMEREAPPWSG